MSTEPASAGKPAVVYGASGYTGRLICEYLREFNVPFVAAGRDKARIAGALGQVPGLDTVEHEIVEVAHDVGPLTELFSGARVVCNTVGPFGQYGHEVVEARPASCRPMRRIRCCSSRRTGWGSPPAARRSATASCWACCAASAWSWSRT
jgi:hypothetical protein